MPQQRLLSPYAPGKTLFCSITSPIPFGHSNGAACPLNQTGVILRQRSRCMRRVTRDGLRGVVIPCSHAVSNGDIQLPPSTSTLCCCWYRVLSNSDTRVNGGFWKVMSESRESTWSAAADGFCTWWPIEGERGACFKKSAAVHAPVTATGSGLNDLRGIVLLMSGVLMNGPTLMKSRRGLSNRALHARKRRCWVCCQSTRPAPGGVVCGHPGYQRCRNGCP